VGVRGRKGFLPSSCDEGHKSPRMTGNYTALYYGDNIIRQLSILSQCPTLPSFSSSSSYLLSPVCFVTMAIPIPSHPSSIVSHLRLPPVPTPLSFSLSAGHVGLSFYPSVTLKHSFKVASFPSFDQRAFAAV
jgi:hypothetical protein